MRSPAGSCIGAAFLAFALALPAAGTEIQRVRSPGGIEAWLVEDASVPVISLRLAFKGGGALDPEGKQGLANMVSGLLDEGAGDLDSQAFREALEEIVASIGFDAAAGRLYGSLRTLSEHRARAFALLRMALTAPRFDTEPVERIRRQIVAGIESGKDNPGRIARPQLEPAGVRRASLFPAPRGHAGERHRDYGRGFAAFRPPAPRPSRPHHRRGGRHLRRRARAPARRDVWRAARIRHVRGHSRGIAGRAAGWKSCGRKSRKASSSSGRPG